jgi:hypothetical protein
MMISRSPQKEPRPPPPRFVTIIGDRGAIGDRAVGEYGEYGGGAVFTMNVEPVAATDVGLLRRRTGVVRSAQEAALGPTAVDMAAAVVVSAAAAVRVVVAVATIVAVVMLLESLGDSPAPAAAPVADECVADAAAAADDDDDEIPPMPTPALSPAPPCGRVLLDTNLRAPPACLTASRMRVRSYRIDSSTNSSARPPDRT